MGDYYDKRAYFYSVIYNINKAIEYFEKSY